MDTPGIIPLNEVGSASKLSGQAWQAAYDCVSNFHVFQGEAPVHINTIFIFLDLEIHSELQRLPIPKLTSPIQSLGAFLST